MPTVDLLSLYCMWGDLQENTRIKFYDFANVFMYETTYAEIPLEEKLRYEVLWFCMKSDGGSFYAEIGLVNAIK